MKILWCEEHGQSELGEGLCVYGKTGAAYLGDCRMAAMRLTSDSAETVERIATALLNVKAPSRIVARKYAELILAAIDGETP